MTTSSYTQNIGNSNLIVPSSAQRVLNMEIGAGFRVQDSNDTSAISLYQGGALVGASDPTGDGSTSKLNISSVPAESIAQLRTVWDDSDVAQLDLISNSTGSFINLEALSIYLLSTFLRLNITEYATNAAALGAGLIAGQVYHTAGVVKIVI